MPTLLSNVLCSTCFQMPLAIDWQTKRKNYFRNFSVVLKHCPYCQLHFLLLEVFYWERC
jgi:hypothetical protein